jgi:hypothetical protein
LIRARLIVAAIAFGIAALTLWRTWPWLPQAPAERRGAAVQGGEDFTAGERKTLEDVLKHRGQRPQ